MHEIFDMPFFVCQGKPHVTLLSHLQVPVPLLKEKIATVTGILSEQQRLICRGRVLKDDELLSAYRILTYLVVPSSILFFSVCVVRFFYSTYRLLYVFHRPMTSTTVNTK